MADSRYSSMAAMMGGTGGTATVPTQNFAASNILGTPPPQVGDNRARPNYNGVIANTSNIHVALIVVAIIGVGYVVYHFNFEK